jgi:hypothetical protein
MVKDKIHILPTHNTPEVIFSPEGVIKIKGRALSLNSTEFPEQIIKGFESYLKHPPDKTDIILAFEYLNSFSTNILVSFLERLPQTILPPKKYSIKWYYEKDDDDMLELGQYISEIYHLPVDIIRTEDIKNV